MFLPALMPPPVQDLRTLRQLALYLVRHDAVTFLSYLEGLRGSEGKACVWIYHDAAHVLFEMVGGAQQLLLWGGTTHALMSVTPERYRSVYGLIFMSRQEGGFTCTAAVRRVPPIVNRAEEQRRQP